MRKLATLEVWEAEDADPQVRPSALQFQARYTENMELDVQDSFYRLQMNPRYDQSLMANPDRISIAAHELGHFISAIFKTPESRLATIIPQPEEQLAWKIAEKMEVPIDAKTKNEGLRSYIE